MRTFIHLNSFTLDSFLDHIYSHTAPIITREELTPYERALITKLSGTKAPDGCDFALFTSGSTGTPKLVCLSYQHLLENAKITSELLGITSSCVIQTKLPPWHIGGLLLQMRAHSSGATLVSKWSSHVTDTSVVPTQLKRLLKEGADLSQYRCILLGGAPIDQELREMISNLPVHILYGMTELMGTVAIDGQLLPGVECSITDQIYIRSPRAFCGYLTDTAFQSAAAMHPTWDLGSFQNGKLEVTGRKDRMIISGGENIDPQEVENALKKLPEIRQCYVRGEPDPDWGQAVIAYVDTELSAETILKNLHDIIPRFKVPKKILAWARLGGKFNFK